MTKPSRLLPSRRSTEAQWAGIPGLALRQLQSDAGNEFPIPVDPGGRERRFIGATTATLRRNPHPGYHVPQLALRADAGDEGEPIGFVGHAAVFDQPTWIGSRAWGFEEVVAPEAFDATITQADVRFLHNHNPDLLLARTSNETLRLSTDGTGLVADADMAPTSYALDLSALLARGDVDQMSFAFRTVADKWEWVEREDGSEYERRTLLEVELFDVSTVTYPAYDGTDAGLRYGGGSDRAGLMADAGREHGPSTDTRRSSEGSEPSDDAQIRASRNALEREFEDMERRMEIEGMTP